MQEGNEIDKYDLNHSKLKRHPFMTLNVMVVGKFYDNFDDFTTKQNQCDLYKHNIDDDPSLLAVNIVHKVCYKICRFVCKSENNVNFLFFFFGF